MDSSYCGGSSSSTGLTCGAACTSCTSEGGRGGGRGGGGGGAQILPHHRLDVHHHLLGPGAGHGEELAVDMPPAGEQAVGGQEEEEVLPPQPQLVLVQHHG